MTSRIVVGITGYRTLGYRAAKELGFKVRPGEITFEEDHKAEETLNPAKLLSATATLNVRYDGEDQWWPVPGTVYWEERAPVVRPRGEKEPWLQNGPWVKQPRHMLAKCAEADAWRRVAPDDLGGTYAPEEMDRPMMDITAEVERLDEEGRWDKVGGHWV